MPDTNPPGAASETLSELRAAIAEARRLKEDDGAGVVSPPADGPPEPFERGDEVELGHRLLAELARGSPSVVGDMGFLWCYDRVRGVFSEIPREEQEKRISGYAGAWVVAGRTQQGETTYKPLKVSASSAKGACRMAYVNACRSGFFQNARPGLAFRNGFLAFEKGEVVFREHRASHRARVHVPCDWNKDAKAPHWEKYLATTLPEEEAGLLQEFGGVCLLGQATVLQKCLIFQGSGENGKSVALTAITSLFPAAALTSVPPQKFDDDYWRARLSNALLNAVADIPAREILESSHFKEVITGDMVGARSPHFPPFEFRPRAGHLFSANELPKVMDRTRGFRRRFLVLPFEKTFTEEQKIEGLGEKIATKEKAGLYAWFIEGGVRALRRGRYAEPESSRKALEKWFLQSDTLAHWTTYYVEKAGKAESRDFIYADYREWCLKNGHKAQSSTKFTEGLPDLGWTKGRTKAWRFWTPPAEAPIQDEEEEEKTEKKNPPREPGADEEEGTYPEEPADTDDLPF